METGELDYERIINRELTLLQQAGSASRPWTKTRIDVPENLI
jgi:hypothetical protein